eukprot:m.188344 g.188344  ORF g.188344 m.188344 type:complete len:94 (+) comp24824_c1_seq1:514-795(+)
MSFPMLEFSDSSDEDIWLDHSHSYNDDLMACLSSPPRSPVPALSPTMMDHDHPDFDLELFVLGPESSDSSPSQEVAGNCSFGDSEFHSLGKRN